MYLFLELLFCNVSICNYCLICIVFIISYCKIFSFLLSHSWCCFLLSQCLLINML
jgi:hypothetical protein